MGNEVSDQPRTALMNLSQPDPDQPDPSLAALNPADAANPLAAASPVDASSQDTPAEDRPVRVGSPFAVDPVIAEVQTDFVAAPIEPLADLGPMRYTALGAVGASMMVVAFGVASVWWFPVGGTVIAGLGCGLSIFGFFSNQRIWAAGLLIVHVTLFLANYSQSIA